MRNEKQFSKQNINCTSIMSFKLTNTSTIFQKLINHVLYNHLNEFVITYLNDILIFSETEKKHEKHVKKVLKKFQEKNLYFKLKKMQIS